MATTCLMPLHIGKGRTVTEALGRTTDYVKNPEKTESERRRRAKRGQLGI